MPRGMRDRYYVLEATEVEPQEIVRCYDGSVMTRHPEGHGERKVYCSRYDDCLGEAMRRRWRGFGCEACGVDDPISKEQARDELIGIAALINAARGHWRLASQGIRAPGQQRRVAKGDDSE